jgi:hypothetical protein
MANPYEGDSTTTVAGIIGTNSTTGYGVSGSSQSGHGVEGNSVSGNAVYGTSKNSDAVVGFAAAAGKGGVLGLAPNGNAVTGISDNYAIGPAKPALETLDNLVRRQLSVPCNYQFQKGDFF